MKAQDITKALRVLLPDVQPLSTRTDLSSNGLILSYTVTMPEPAARNLNACSYLTAGRIVEHISRQVGRDLRVKDVYATRRTTGGRLVHLVVETV